MCNAEDNYNDDKVQKLVEVYVKYEKDLRTYAKSFLADTHKAEDIVQTVFMDLLRRIDKVTFGQAVQMKSLLMMLVRWRIQNEFCYEQKHMLDVYMNGDCKTVIEDPCYEMMEFVEVIQAIEWVEHKNKTYAEALIYTVLGYDSSELENMLGVSAATIRKRASRGRKLLKKRLIEIGYLDGREDYKLF